MHFLAKLGLLASQAVNAILFRGDPDESLSARAHRERWPKGEARIDRVLGAGHCASVRRAQISRELARALAKT
jgi:hypothetical protein